MPISSQQVHLLRLPQSGCHASGILANYDNINTRHTVPETALPQAGFSFQSVESTASGVGRGLGNHPNFAMAWVLALPVGIILECSATDPDVLALADGFSASGHDLTQLFAAFFTSPLVTLTSDREDSPAPGAQVSVARVGHYCHAMRARLSDARAAQGHTNLLPRRLDICSEDNPAAVLSASSPKDLVVQRPRCISLATPRPWCLWRSRACVRSSPRMSSRTTTEPPSTPRIRSSHSSS